MKGEARRQEIIRILSEAKEAVSGTELARRLGVSRQVIVQDMALLRTSYRNIIATNRGYLLYEESPKREWFRREVRVRHGREDIVRELDCIVDAGGWVVDVIVEHEIYGRLSGDLVIRSRADVREFMRRVEEHRTKPLTELTEGIHLHTIEAEREETLDAVEKALAEAGFLVTMSGEDVNSNGFLCGE
ncbi:MAG: transcription repressor NadR [Lachnospiraceae bacterium]|nr:transcription repressor NadR [Lachnospiraceae bacterium]